ncbi:MAG: DUF2089 domain-containing protein [bacterium]|nr:DUF2089 domain-containing protein [bacterium]
MVKKVLNQCPVCGKDLYIKELKCDSCGTEYKGKFEICDICKLPQDQIDFIRIFIKNQGNIKGVEKDLNISYPTVKNKLAQVIRALGFEIQIEIEEAEEELVKERNKILSMLETGEISSDEALSKLNKLK